MSTTMEPAHSPSMQPASDKQFGIWKRLLWKDLRELLPIWITLIAGAAVCACLLTLEDSQTFRSWRSQTIVSGIQAFAIMTSFATGVLLFAPEREQGTVHLLRSLPIQPKRIVWAKLIAGVLGVIAVLIALTLVLKLSLQNTNRAGDWLTLLYSSFWTDQLVRITTPVLVFLLGAFAAMRTGSTFYGFSISAVLGIASAFLVGYVSLEINRTIEVNSFQAIGSLVAVLAMLAGTLSSGRIWLEERKRTGFASQDETVASEIDFVSGSRQAVKFQLARAPSGKIFWPLLWQSFRISRVPVAILLTFAVTTLLVFCGMWIAAQYDRATGFGAGIRHYFEIAEYIVAFMTLGTFTAMICVFGTVFWHDQQNGRLRFYQQHVERPRLLWLTRLLPWFFLFLVVTLIAAFVGWFLLHASFRDGFRIEDFGSFESIWFNTAPSVAIGLVSILAIGQWWSMQIRNPIIAIVLTLISAAVLCWLGSNLPLLGEPLTWFLPSIAVLFWATWYRSKSWLADSATWRTHAVTFGSIIATMGFSFAAFACHRAFEYPDLQLDTDNIAAQFAPDQRGVRTVERLQFGTPAERKETADMYRQAMSEIKGELSNGMAGLIYGDWNFWEDESQRGTKAAHSARLIDYDKKVKAWVERNEEPLKLVLKASERVACDPFHVDYLYRQTDKLRSLTMANCLLMLQQNRNEEALRSIWAYDRVCQRTDMGLSLYQDVRIDDRKFVYELLIRWAEKPNQSADAIQAVIDRLKHDSVAEEPAILEFSDSTPTANRQQQVNAQTAIHLWNDYTRWRGEARWFGLNYHFHIVDNDMLDDGNATSLTWPWEKERRRRFRKTEAIRRFQTGLVGHRRDQMLPRPDYGSYINSGWANRSVRDEYNFGMTHPQHAEYHRAVANATQETNRRYTMLRLALAAYRIENGKLPETIHDLSSYFDGKLPKTVYTNANFGWLPEGLPVQGFLGRQPSPVILPPNVPLLLPYGLAQPIDTSKRESFNPDNNSDDTEMGIPIQPIDSDWELRRHAFDPVVSVLQKTQ